MSAADEDYEPYAVTQAKEYASSAAECIRSLTYATLPHEGAPGLEYPGDVYEIVASLKVAVQRMPQLFGQLSLWLGKQNAAGRVGHDSGQEAGEHVTAVRDALDYAATCAGTLGRALDQAHNASAGLKAAEGKR
jgi:hypothetical protein